MTDPDLLAHVRDDLEGFVDAAMGAHDQLHARVDLLRYDVGRLQRALDTANARNAQLEQRLRNP